MIYLPPYGWVPVDTTVAQSADWDTDLSLDDKKAFKNYFFSHLDSYRMVIQNDVDIALSPTPKEVIPYAIAIQTPAISCSTSEIDLKLLVAQRWKFKIKENQGVIK